MRGDDRQPDTMFSYVSAEQRVPPDHPLRAIILPSRGEARGRPDVGRALHGRRDAIEAWASQKSFNGRTVIPTATAGTSRGQQWKNDTHASTTDPDARLYRRSNQADSRLAYLGHLLIENRHGLIADAMATTADGFGEREAATLMLHAQWQRAPGRPADSAYSPVVRR